MKVTRITVLFVALTLALAACSGGDESGTTDAPATSSAASETTQPSKTTSGAVDSLEDVRGAIVRIVAEGSFVDPEFGQQFNAAGSGSGFFIDESGIAVTNNHVVTGAAFLHVYVDGEDEPRNARVLGVSECSDLAIIDVDGDGYPFLEWYDGDISVGTGIFAAGFPLGDDEFTLLDGIISKENADGESDWASVDSVIEHSADTLPGSSGGPIVTSDGKIVAVNYAGDSAGQSFAIGRDEALKVIPRLIDGEDVTSIGINGQALYDGALSGIWVASVASGSPADLGGIKAGDLVTLVEGLIPATDGTMADYCDILRSHRPGDPLGVEIYRPSDDAFLEGTLNTDKVLDFSYSFVSQLGDEVADTGTTGVAGYDTYVTLVDAEGIMSVDVPAAWVDTNVVDPWVFNDEYVGVAISAAVDRVAWQDGWVTPGMFFGASTTLPLTETVTSMLDGHDFSFACDFDGRYDYSDPLYDGQYDLWVNCEGSDTWFVDLVAQTPDGAALLMVQVVVVTDADLEALDAVLASFLIDEVALAALSGTSTTTSSSFGVFNFADLFTGECFNPSSAAFEETTYGVDVDVVGCDSPHTAEVYGNYFVTEATEFPGESALIDIADDYCYTEFSSYVGSSYEESALDYWSYWPTASGWDSGYQFVMCALVDFGGGDLIGSAWQTGW